MSFEKTKLKKEKGEGNKSDQTNQKLIDQQKTTQPPEREEGSRSLSPFFEEKPKKTKHKKKPP